MNKLYKYMSLYVENEDSFIFNQNTINSILDSTLYFSKVEQFNDPFELRPQFDYNFTDEQFLSVQKEKHMKKKPNKSEKEIDEELKNIVENDIHRPEGIWASFFQI